MEDVVLRLTQVLPRIYGFDFPRPIDWTLRKGEQWCVIGPNGAGKTMLADLLCGKYAVKSGKIDYVFWTDAFQKTTRKTYPSAEIKKVGFESAYLLSDYKNMYYQQRFSSTENEFSPTVKDLVDAESDKDYVQMLCQRMHVDRLYEKHLIMLSSGELRRLLIVLALADRPQLIIFDNPFIGLDVEMRAELDEFFIELSSFQQMVFLVPATNEIPKVANRILKADALQYEDMGSVSDFLENQSADFESVDSVSIGDFPTSGTSVARECQYVLKMKDINVAYGAAVLFKNLNWEIKRGEKWALVGRNGSGKSTLLSLLAADNPKAYSLDITIFDRRRGTGESIWDIKKPIGYISSEMHLFFQENQECKHIVGSGFFDTIGLFRSCSDEQMQLSLRWMDLLGIRHLADRRYLTLSSGEQRMVLLARTLVKNPDLLILDEPLHGLDLRSKQRCRAVIERFCEQKGKTMIYVTHRREEIPSCVDHFFELKKL